MAVTLGKRKRREDISNKPQAGENDSDDDATARALFQRAFEAKFKPLEKVEKPLEQSDSGSDADDSQDIDEDDEWDGLSEDGDAQPQIEIIQDKPANIVDPDRQKRELKAFMSSKPPTASAPTSLKSTKAATKDPTGDDETESTNLKNDLALQRLLKESHLLDANTFTTGPADTTPEGKSRLKALDMRIQDLGGKKSHLEQDRMPLSHRRGIVAKSSDREAKRRLEAKENGIILERVKGGKGSKEPARRERGVGGPSVGKFGSATLRLSKDDVRGIQGSGQRGGGKGKRGGRGGRR